MSALQTQHSASKEDAAAAGQRQYLIFSLGGESFAIDILHIKEIIEFSSLTEVPLMPGFIRGVINLRGAVVPVIDLCARFGRGQTEVTRRTCIVIVELTDKGSEERAIHDIGVMVDTVNEVVDIPSSEVEPPPSFGAQMRSDFISGMGKYGDDFVIMLELDTVLSVDDMSALSADVVGSALSPL
ncbi:chemotaxis protein CheW [Uliginosibacterium sediminicola]|uniref:Chemotaxis protein CheW n=1 Tax=Uliginosibacterium sediminicola TaxID=2024550 RepID=A0ABU9YUR4_9RHOO